MTSTLRSCLLALAAGLALHGAQAEMPAALAGKQLKVIVPQTTGGASDVLARVMAQEMGKRWNASIVVENRAGAGGVIGSDLVAKAAPDGATWLMSYSGTHSINPSLYKSMPFDTLKDLAPIGSLATLPFVLVVDPKLPVANLGEFIAYAKANPGRVNLASSGNGSVAHLLAEMLASAAGVKITHVPYKGVAPALTDVIGGQVQGIFASAPSVMGHIRNGTVRALAASATRRSAALAELPTFAEAGYPALAIDSWFAFFVPAATPAALRAQIHAELNKALSDKEVAARFAGQGADPMVTTLDAFNRIVASDMDKWGKAVRDSGAKID